MAKSKQPNGIRQPKSPKIVNLFLPVCPAIDCKWEPAPAPQRTAGRAEKAFLTHALADHNVVQLVRVEKVVTLRVLSD